MNLEYPIWLLGWIALPVLVLAAFLAEKFRKDPGAGFAAERLRGRLVRKDHPLPRWLAFGMLLAAIGALALALARPQGDGGVKTQTSEGRNVIIALDLSRSMRVGDVSPDRLGQAKVVIYELLESLGNDRVGLVGFAGGSYLYAPLTIDHEAVRETVEQMDENWVAKGGSDISAAIRMATTALKETGQRNNALVVISDGEEHEGDLDAIVAEAERSGVTIFAIGVGTEDGGFVPHPDFPGGLVDRNGQRVLSRLQPEILRKLATETGGRYILAGRGADIPGMIKAAVEGMDSFRIEGGQTRIAIEFYQWALLPGILFLMGAIVAGTRWRGLGRSGAAAAVLLFAASPGADADQLGRAREAFAERNYDKARDGFREIAEGKTELEDAAAFRLGEGRAAYEAGDFRGARAAYSGALLADDAAIVGEGHKGIGDTLFQQGWMGLSGSSYPGGEETPDLEVFEKLVREQLERMSGAEIPDGGESNEFVRLDAIIINWADAVKHYRSALDSAPDNGAARKNEGLTMRYLKKLREILAEEKDKAEEEMPERNEGSGQGSSPPQEGQSGEEGEPDEGQGQDGGGEGEKEEEAEGGGGEKGEGEGGEEKKPYDGDGKDGKEEKDEGVHPGETPEERAGRILSENADVERGPMASGAKRDLRPPDKDW